MLKGRGQGGDNVLRLLRRGVRDEHVQNKLYEILKELIKIFIIKETLAMISLLFSYILKFYSAMKPQSLYKGTDRKCSKLCDSPRCHLK